MASSISSISSSSPSERVPSLSWGLSSACDTGEAHEESPEEGESEDGSGDVGIDGDGVINSTQDDTTDRTVDAALDEAGECRWGD